MVISQASAGAGHDLDTRNGRAASGRDSQKCQEEWPWQIVPAGAKLQVRASSKIVCGNSGGAR
jgi:hypothetical protein